MNAGSHPDRERSFTIDPWTAWAAAWRAWRYGTPVALPITMNTTNITANEAVILHSIATNDFAPGNGCRPETFTETGPVWSNCLDGLPSRSIPGVVASLSKKGLVRCSGSGSELTVALTEAGFAAWQASGK